MALRASTAPKIKWLAYTYAAGVRRFDDHSFMICVVLGELLVKCNLLHYMLLAQKSNLLLLLVT